MIFDLFQIIAAHKGIADARNQTDQEHGNHAEDQDDACFDGRILYAG